MPTCVTLLIALLADDDVDCNPSESGRDYTGHTAETASGRTCQAWSYRLGTTGYYDGFFVDGSVTSARNYCRNPAANNFTGVWCFTTDPGQLWERCDVPRCSGQCTAFVWVDVNPLIHGFYFQGKTWLALLLGTSGDWNETFFHLNTEWRFFTSSFL